MIKTPSGELTQGSYCAFNRRMHRALVPGVDDDTCRVAARSDWLSDAKGGDSMPYNLFAERYCVVCCCCVVVCCCCVV